MFARVPVPARTFCQDLRHLVGDRLGEDAFALRLAEVFDVSIGKDDALDGDRLVADPRRRAWRRRLPSRAARRRGSGLRAPRPDSRRAWSRFPCPWPCRRRSLGRGRDRAARRPCCPIGASPAPGSSSRHRSGHRSGPSRGRMPASSGRGLGHIRGRIRVDAALDRRRQHEGLERRARLPVSLCGEVELLALVRRARCHRPDVARARIDRHDRRTRVRRIGKR